MEKLERKLTEENIEYRIFKKMDSRGILGCLEKIDEADVVYVVVDNQKSITDQKPQFSIYKRWLVTTGHKETSLATYF